MTTETTTTTDETPERQQQAHYLRQGAPWLRQESQLRADRRAWETEDGSVYVKLAGKQVVDQGFTLYAAEDNDKAGA